MVWFKFGIVERSYKVSMLSMCVTQYADIFFFMIHWPRITSRVVPSIMRDRRISTPGRAGCTSKVVYRIGCRAPLQLSFLEVVASILLLSCGTAPGVWGQLSMPQLYPALRLLRIGHTFHIHGLRLATGVYCNPGLRSLVCHWGGSGVHLLDGGIQALSEY